MFFLLSCECAHFFLPLFFLCLLKIERYNTHEFVFFHILMSFLRFFCRICFFLIRKIAIEKGNKKSNKAFIAFEKLRPSNANIKKANDAIDTEHTHTHTHTNT